MDIRTIELFRMSHAVGLCERKERFHVFLVTFQTFLCESLDRIKN